MSKRSVFLVAMLAALGLLWSVSAQAGCINVWIDGTTTVEPGTTVTIPVHISDVGQGVHQIYSYEFVVTYCGAGDDMLTFVGVDDDGTIPSAAGWLGPEANEDPSGTITIASAGSEPLVGQGDLIKLVFDVSDDAVPCDVCDIDLVSLHFNQPDQDNEVCLDGGQVYVKDYSFGGRVVDSCGRAMKGVKVRYYGSCGDEDYLRTTWTDADGRYYFGCLPPCLEDDPSAKLVVSAVYDEDEKNGMITTMDAARVLQYTVGLRMIPDTGEFCGSGHSADWLAAETSGDGIIGSYDAALILRYLVGDIGHMPAFDGAEWVFCNGISLGFEGAPGVDFDGLLVGDVTRCDDDASKMALGGDAALHLSMKELEKGLTQVSIDLDSDAQVYGGMITLDVAPGVELVTSDAVQSAMVAAHQDGHSVRVAFAGASALASDGGIATLSFRGPADVDAYTLTSAQLNDGAVNVTFGDKPVVDTPSSKKLELLGNYPNPFNPRTEITFYIPEKAPTTVAIFDASGRKIRTLASNQMMEGEVSMVWDGLNDQGGRVASGTYFYRVKAGNQIASKSMVLVK